MKPIFIQKSKELNICGWQAVSTLFARHPGAALYGARIGYNAVYAVGGSLVRFAQ